MLEHRLRVTVWADETLLVTWLEVDVSPASKRDEGANEMKGRYALAGVALSGAILRDFFEPLLPLAGVEISWAGTGSKVFNGLAPALLDRSFNICRLSFNLISDLFPKSPLFLIR